MVYFDFVDIAIRQNSWLCRIITKKHYEIEDVLALIELVPDLNRSNVA